MYLREKSFCLTKYITSKCYICHNYSSKTKPLTENIYTVNGAVKIIEMLIFFGHKFEGEILASLCPECLQELCQSYFTKNSIAISNTVSIHEKCDIDNSLPHSWPSYNYNGNKNHLLTNAKEFETKTDNSFKINDNKTLTSNFNNKNVISKSFQSIFNKCTSYFDTNDTSNKENINKYLFNEELASDMDHFQLYSRKDHTSNSLRYDIYKSSVNNKISFDISHSDNTNSNTLNCNEVNNNLLSTNILGNENDNFNNQPSKIALNVDMEQRTTDEWHFSECKDNIIGNQVNIAQYNNTGKENEKTATVQLDNFENINQNVSGTKLKEIFLHLNKLKAEIEYKESDKRINSKHKEMKCYICHKNYNPQTLPIHMKSHIGKIYRCNICGINFTKKIAKEHITVHEKYKINFLCLECNKNFSSDELNRHCCLQKIKVANNEIECHFCDSTFISQKRLRTHIEKHYQIENKFFYCPICPRKYRRQNSLEDHLSQVHF